MKRHVLAFDPGVTTGIALCNPRGQIIGVQMIKGADAEMELGRLMVKTYAKYPDLHVVVEDFVGMGKRSPEGIYTLKMVGWLTNLARFQGISGALHPPQARKHKLEEATRQIKKAGLIFATHTMDASGHALAHWSALDE